MLEEKEKMVQEIFRHTTTIGIRECGMRRYVLEREIVTVQTPYGPVRCKISNGYGTMRRKFEYEDLSRIAAQEHMELSASYSLLRWIRSMDRKYFHQQLSC